MASRFRPLWPTKLRTRILKEFDRARGRGKAGLLKALCAKYGITRQHEWKWRKEADAEFDANLDMARGVEF